MRLILLFILFQLSLSAQKMIFRSFDEGHWTNENIIILYPNNTFDCLHSMEYTTLESGTWDTSHTDSITLKFDSDSKSELLKIGESEFYKFTVVDGDYDNRFIKCYKYLNNNETSASYDSVVVVKQGEVDSLYFESFGYLSKHITLNYLEPGHYLVFLTDWNNSSSNKNKQPLKGVLKCDYLKLDERKLMKRLK